VTVNRDKVLIIKPTRCTDFSEFTLGMKLYMFWTVPLSIIRSFSLYTQQLYMSYMFADNLRAGLGWNFCSILILLARCHPTCMTYTIAECTAKNSWWWTEELSETRRASFQEKIWEICESSWFYYKKQDITFSKPSWHPKMICANVFIAYFTNTKIATHI